MLNYDFLKHYLRPNHYFIKVYSNETHFYLVILLIWIKEKGGTCMLQKYMQDAILPCKKVMQSTKIDTNHQWVK